MSKSFLLLCFGIAASTSSCQMLREVNSSTYSIRRNRMAIEESTRVIENNARVIEESTRAIEENIEALNKATGNIEKLNQES